jgi:(p)ppGpp synthase/HD superfamily hydrolase
MCHGNDISRPGCPQVFAPLARLLGLYSIKEELEALSFKHSQPKAHQVSFEYESST